MSRSFTCHQREVLLQEHPGAGFQLSAVSAVHRTYEALVLQPQPCSCGSDGHAGSASNLPALVAQALQAAFDASPSAFLRCSLDALTDPDRALRTAASNFLRAQLDGALQTPQNGMAPASAGADRTVICRAALLSEHVRAWAPERLKSLAEGVLCFLESCKLNCRARK